VAKRYVLEQKLLLTAYRKCLEFVYKKSIGTQMNDLDLCIEVVQGHVNYCGVNISKTRKLCYRKDDRTMRTV